jgi:hypothetical protein
MNRQIILVKRPDGLPSEECFKLLEGEIPELKDGEVLVKTMYLSVDPYMRGRMNDGKSYISPFALNEVLTGGVVGEVVESKSDEFAKGDMVMGGFLGWQDYSIAKAGDLIKVENKDLSPGVFLGILGMPGLTAYFGILDVGKPKAGETVVVSGAAGAVGMTAGQIAKIKGCTVIGISGSDKKNEYLVKELGFDNALNYNTGNLRKELKKICPQGVDVYFDNVGGEISDAVMTLINYKARIPICGQISLYNVKRPPVGPRVQVQLLTKSAVMEGFLIFDYKERFGEGMEQLSKWISENKLKYSENIVEGLENAPKAFLGLFAGENLGKQIVKVV